MYIHQIFSRIPCNLAMYYPSLVMQVITKRLQNCTVEIRQSSTVHLYDYVISNLYSSFAGIYPVNKVVFRAVFLSKVDNSYTKILA